MRLKAKIAYDGTDFYGFQIQDERFPTIQSELEKALEQICRFPVRIHGAGRTDTGVHAYGQVAHFDWDHSLPPDKLTLGLNAILPEAIRVMSLEPVDPLFHARFDAHSKIYLYRIDSGRIYNPFTYRYALHVRYPLDIDLLHRCARVVEGEHDFSAFQATGTEVVTTRRNMMSAEILPELRESPYIPPLMCIRFRADGFLRKMVRFLVGTFLEIASGRRKFEDLEAALESGNRALVGIPAAARGLFLEHVFYDEE